MLKASILKTWRKVTEWKLCRSIKKFRKTGGKGGNNPSNKPHLDVSIGRFFCLSYTTTLQPQNISAQTTVSPRISRNVTIHYISWLILKSQEFQCAVEL
jgi:hypothetical protein